MKIAVKLHAHEWDLVLFALKAAEETKAGIARSFPEGNERAAGLLGESAMLGAVRDKIARRVHG